MKIPLLTTIFLIVFPVTQKGDNSQGIGQEIIDFKRPVTQGILLNNLQYHAKKKTALKTTFLIDVLCQSNQSERPTQLERIK